MNGRVIILVLTLILSLTNVRDSSGRPTVGVQRWDMYSGGTAWTQQQELGYLPGQEGFLKPEEWQFRAPFFVRRTEDVTWVNHPDNAGPLWFNYPFDSQVLQDAMDQEIDYAADAGIDYFIFNGPTRTLFSNGWELHDNLDAYLVSSKRERINFTFALYGHNAIDYGKTKVDLMLDEIIPYMQSSTWQTIEDGRPLLPVLWPIQFRDMLASQSGSEQMTLAEFVTHIRDRVTAVGLPNPYIVGEEIAQTYNYADELLAAGFDAMSDYAGAYGGGTAPRDQAPSYAQATLNLFATYDQDFKPKALDFVAPMTDQFYPWPRADANGQTEVYHYQWGQPGDLAERMNAVIDYVDNNPNDTAETIFIYSWNESSEGGGLIPSMGAAPSYIPVTDRLDELATVLNPGGPGNPGDGNGDGKVDGLDYLIWAGNFGDDPADDPPGSPENGDFNDDGVVNSLDYLLWAGNYGQGPNDATAVPEPGSILIALVAIAVLLMPRMPRRF